MARKRASKPVKGAWIVKMRCTITKSVYCVDCTEEEARTNPFDHAIEETETGQEDYEVQSVEPEA